MRGKDISNSCWKKKCLSVMLEKMKDDGGGFAMEVAWMGTELSRKKDK